MIVFSVAVSVVDKEDNRFRRHENDGNGRKMKNDFAESRQHECGCSQNSAEIQICTHFSSRASIFMHNIISIFSKKPLQQKSCDFKANDGENVKIP